jgi:hypothetical protein
MRPKPRLFPAAAGVPTTALLTSNLLGSTVVWGAEVASALPSLSGTLLSGPFPAMATLTAADLNDAGRTLVSVDDGVESVACLGSGTSWARVADFTAPAFPATGNALVQKDVIAGNRVGWSSSGEFVTVDGLTKEIRRRADTTLSTIVNAVNHAGTAAGQWRMVTSVEVFSIERLDTDQGGSGQVIGRGWSYVTTYDVAATAFVGSAALRCCRARTFRGAQRECDHISGANRECSPTRCLRHAGERHPEQAAALHQDG